MGQLFISGGLKPDPMKVEAIASMLRPDDKRAVERLLECVNYLFRFMPQLSKVSEPLRKLTKKNVMFTWDSSQEEAYRAIKSMISSVPLLKHYDVASKATTQCDASESGLGATLLQDGQPVEFASRLLGSVEHQYPQIEKECLAIVCSCSRFNHYLHGREFNHFHHNRETGCGGGRSRERGSKSSAPVYPPNHDIPPKTDHNTRNYMPYSLRQVCGFFYVPQHYEH